MSDEDDDQLLQQGVDGVGRLFDRHSRAVFRLAFALLRDIDEANDVVQDTFVVAWRKRRQITLLDGSSLPWLLTTARFTAMAARRKRASRAAHTTDLDDAAVLPDSGFADVDAVQAALAELSDQDQKVLRLVLIEGYGYSAAAAQLGVSISAVGKRLQRARGRFRASYSGIDTSAQGADS